jgi:metal-responsive CopG/Arc/MetJ family transcriptional regulator
MKSTSGRRINLLLPADLAEELDRLVPPRRRGRVIAKALAGELRRLKAQHAIEQSAGAWSDAAHPELTSGKEIDRWIARGRRELAWDTSRGGGR